MIDITTTLKLSVKCRAQTHNKRTSWFPHYVFNAEFQTNLISTFRNLITSLALRFDLRRESNPDFKCEAALQQYYSNAHVEI